MKEKMRDSLRKITVILIAGVIFTLSEQLAAQSREMVALGLSAPEAKGVGSQAKNGDEAGPSLKGQQQVKPRSYTVLDYYLLLPDQYLHSARVKNRRSIIKVSDIKNGYLRLEDGWDGWAEIALFKKSDGSSIIAVEEMVCGPACGCESFRFLEYDNGNWIDVTKDVLPKIPEKVLRSEYRRLSAEANRDTPNYYYQLPRVGTDIKVVIPFLAKFDAGFSFESKAVLKLSWNGKKFKLQKINE
jgi:hypothetical protein